LDTTTERVEEQCENLVRLGQFLRAAEPRTMPDGSITGCYEFSHSMYQTVLYERAPTIRRVRLHRRIGEQQERAYDARAGEVAAELAVHFERGQDAARAVHYLQLAAENVLKRYAHREAAAYQQRALAVLSTLPDAPEKRQRELALQLALGVSLTVTNGFADPRVERVYARARTLCQQVGATPALVPVLYGLWNFSLVRSQYQAAQELADQLVRITEQDQEPAFLLAAHNAQTQTLFLKGQFAAARPHMEHVFTRYSPAIHNVLAEHYGEDLGVSCQVFALWLLWLLGYPDQAMQQTQTVKRLADELAHPFSLAQALSFGGQLYVNLGVLPQVRQMADALLTVCDQHDFTLWQASGLGLQGWVLVEEGHEPEGITKLRQCITNWRATGADIWLPLMRAMLAEAYRKAKQPQDGLAVITEALEATQKNGEAWYDAELYRLKGELTLAGAGEEKSPGASVRRPGSAGESQSATGKTQKVKVPNPQSQIPDPTSEAEGYFHHALTIARKQQAKSLELRATLSLARLWHAQGKQQEAQSALSDVYNWFTEGFDTADLQAAKAVLHELASSAPRTSRRPTKPARTTAAKRKSR
jgi:predicted ATPase